MKFGYVLCALAVAAQLRGADGWQPGMWQGERAYSDISCGWKAVVSIDRARLVYLGPDDGKTNLLYSTPTRDHPVGWGGHRLWLGPQVKWSADGWPPPAAWEKSSAAKVELDEKRLRLYEPATGDGWPAVIREYEWRNGALLCNALIHGGTRPAQIIHILQVPSSARVVLNAVLTPESPLGYALLHMGRSISPQTKFEPRKQVQIQDGKLEICFNGTAEKIGTKQQMLVATIGRYELRVARSDAKGKTIKTPDDGFVTQVYLGRRADPIIELEQLSDLWAAGTDASFGILVTPSSAAAR